MMVAAMAAAGWPAHLIRLMLASGERVTDMYTISIHVIASLACACATVRIDIYGIPVVALLVKAKSYLQRLSLASGLSLSR